MTTTVRTSILTFPPEHLDQAIEMMTAAEEELVGIKDLPGLISYHVGVDRATSQIANVSVWDSTEHASAMSSFAPMLALAGRFLEALPGTTFLRPIPNFDELWAWDLTA